MAKQTTKYGPRKLGQKEFEAQQAQKVMTSPSGVVYGKRKGGGPQHSETFKTLRDNLHDLKVDEVTGHLTSIEDPQELAALHALERSNPSYDKGRLGVLNAIEERRGELGIAQEGGEPQTGEKGGEGQGETGEGDGGTPDPLDELRAQLEADPASFDDLLTEELISDEPRQEALALFREIEEAQEEPRAQTLELLDEFTEDGEEE